MLDKIYPRPDFVIFLDAPAEVFFARKPEGTLESCERRRQEYIQLRNVVKNWAVVDVSQPVDKVVSEVSKLIVKFHRSKNGLDLVGEL
jgi:thymidylate kinase